MQRSPSKDQVLQLLKDRNIPITTILDVGILSGTPELISAFPTKTHILFEPLSEYTGAIAHSYRDIDYRLVSAAVSDTDGSVILSTVSKISEDEISHSYIEPGKQPSSNDRVVPMIKLDTYIKDNPVPGPYLLKIDIDGEDLRVVNGAHNVLNECSIVIIEATRWNIAERLQTVCMRGFDLIDIVEPCYYDQTIWQCDLVFIKNELKPKYFKDLLVDFEPDLYEIYRG
ncbi:hypothetical protein BZG35_03870 [Brevundimonas sp. LM2]|nr:hypothetical protein BZG35_03870 [Brevundimonas sp. LM2]